MTGNRIIDYILVGFMLLMTLATASVYTYTVFIYQKPLPDDSGGLARLKGDVRRMVDGNAYQLGKFTVNLPSKNSRLRFLDVNIYLVPFGEADVALFEENKPVIQDKIIGIAGSMEAAELNSISGKILLESRVKKAINALLGQVSVKRIYFTRFVVQ